MLLFYAIFGSKAYLSPEKRFSGSLDYRMSKRQTYSFTRDAHRGPLIKAIYSSPDKTERL